MTATTNSRDWTAQANPSKPQPRALTTPKAMEPRRAGSRPSGSPLRPLMPSDPTAAGPARSRPRVACGRRPAALSRATGGPSVRYRGDGGQAPGLDPALVAQRTEHLTTDQKVAGSN